MTAHEEHHHPTSTGSEGDSHGHGHDHHGHAGHSHAISADANQRWLKIAATALGLYMLGEVLVGFVAHSQALISDAGHMFTDMLQLVMAIAAIHLSNRPANDRMTFGFKRVGVLSALISGVTLVGFGALMAGYAIYHLFKVADVNGTYMLVTALIGIVVNVFSTWAVSKANRQSMAVEGAFQHMLNDLFAFIGTAIAATIILFTGFNRADAIMSLIVAWLMIKAGIPLVRNTGRIFMQGVPVHINTDDIRQEILAIPEIVRIVTIRIWSNSEDEHLLNIKAIMVDGCDGNDVQNRLQTIARRYDLHDHAIHLDPESEFADEHHDGHDHHGHDHEGHAHHAPHNH